MHRLPVAASIPGGRGRSRDPLWIEVLWLVAFFPLDVAANGGRLLFCGSLALQDCIKGGSQVHASHGGTALGRLESELGPDRPVFDRYRKDRSPVCRQQHKLEPLVGTRRRDKRTDTPRSAFSVPIASSESSG